MSEEAAVVVVEAAATGDFHAYSPSHRRRANNLTNMVGWSLKILVRNKGLQNLVMVDKCIIIHLKYLFPLRFSVKPTLPVEERHHQEYEAKQKLSSSTTMLIGEINEIGDKVIQENKLKLSSSSTMWTGEKSEIVDNEFAISGVQSCISLAYTEVDKFDEGQKAYFGSYKEKRKKKGASFAYGTAIIGLVFKHNPQAPCEIIIGSESRGTFIGIMGECCYVDTRHKVHSIRGLLGVYVATSGTVSDPHRIRIRLEREVKKTENPVNFDWVLNKTKELLSSSAKKDCDFMFASVLNKEARLAAVFEELGASGFVIKEFTCVALGCGAIFALEDFVDSAGRLGMLDKKDVHAY